MPNHRVDASRAPVLVVAGEASGDSLAAGVVQHLSTSVVGMGGNQLERVGAELVVHDLRLASMGPLQAVVHAHRYHAALRALRALVSRRRPKVALLVGFSAFNARLGRQLRHEGMRVLWYAPAQVWAWRPKRVHTLSKSCDRVALLLPFEEQLWRRANVQADYVGHPSIEYRYESRTELRQQLGWPATACAVALLPGSRTAEVRRTLEPMLATVKQLRQRRGALAAVLLSDSLSPEDTRWATERSWSMGVTPLTGCGYLPAFDAAVATSGTVTLDCAMAGVPPVITYRTDPLTARLAARLLQTPYVGLPNVLLKQEVFPEALQQHCNAESLLLRLLPLLDQPERYLRSCAMVRRQLTPVSGPVPSQRVAHMLEAWLN